MGVYGKHESVIAFTKLLLKRCKISPFLPYMEIVPLKKGYNEAQGNNGGPISRTAIWKMLKYMADIPGHLGLSVTRIYATTPIEQTRKRMPFQVAASAIPGYW